MCKNKRLVLILILIIIFITPLILIAAEDQSNTIESKNKNQNQNQIKAAAVKLYEDALLYSENGIYLKALDLLQSALKINPYYRDCYIAIANVYSKTNEVDSAIFYLQKVINIDPYYEKSYFNLACVYIDNNNYDSALIYINKAIDLNNKNIDYRFLAMECLLNVDSNFDTFIKHYEFIEKFEPNHSMNQYLYGKYLEKKKDFENAKAAYQKALNLLPTIPQPNLALGELFAAENRIDEAIEYYEAALKDKQTQKRAQLQLAKLYAITKKYDNLIKLWDVQPNNALNAYHLGLAYYKKAIALIDSEKGNDAKQQFEKAYIYLSAVLRLNNEDELARNLLEKIAIRLREQGDKERNNLADYHKIRGLKMLYENGKQLPALFELKTAIKLNSLDIEPRLELAKYYQKKMFFNSAISEYKNIIDIDRTNIFAKDNADILTYNFEKTNKDLLKFLNNQQMLDIEKTKYILQIQNNLNEILHANISEIFSEWLLQFSELNDNFEFVLAPRHYQKIEDLERFARTIDADGIITINLKETEKIIKTKINIYSLYELKETQGLANERIRRANALNIQNNISEYSGNSALLKTCARIFEIIENATIPIGKIKQILPYRAIVNLGWRNGLTKTAELKVFSRQPEKDAFIGKIKVLDLTENYAICDISDKNVMDTIKLNDLAQVIRETPKK